MPDAIPARSFYPPTDFLPPLLKPSRARTTALRALRRAPRHIFRAFPLQQQAIDFCDARPRDQLRLWAIEKDAHGRRSFVAASYAAFWRIYARMLRKSGARCHFYEVLREGYAAKLYFDLEFGVEENAGKRAEDMVEAVKRAVGELVGGGKGKNVVELDSTTGSKFSRHLIFQDVAFHDNVQAGVFARRVVDRVLQHDSGLMMVRKKGGDELTPFVDVGVYTRNRCFRLVGSSKYGKSRRLLSMGADPDARASVSRQLFMRSLVCTVGRGVELLGTVSPRSGDVHGFGNRNVPNGSIVSGRADAGEREKRWKSAYPELDAYVEGIVGPAGGGIYGVTTVGGGEGVVMYAIKGGYKYCGRVGRHHRSNNVILVADVGEGVMWQRCFDPDCRGYRSQPWKMPGELGVGIGGEAGTGGYIDESVDEKWLVEVMQEVENMEGMEKVEKGWEGGIDDADMLTLMNTVFPEADGENER